MSNDTIDPRILTRHGGVRDLSMDVEMEDEPDVGSQIVVGNDDQQFLAAPTFDVHDFDFSFEQPAFLEHSNISSTQPLSADSTTYSFQMPQYTSPGFDGNQPVNTSSHSTIPTGPYIGGFTQQTSQLFSPSTPLNPLEVFVEHDQMWQPHGPFIAPTEQNSQPFPHIQLDSPMLSNLVDSHFNDPSITVSPDSSDLLPEYPNHGPNVTSQMATSTIQRPYLLQSHSSLPAPTTSLDLPFYELSRNEASGSGNVICSETDIIKNPVYGVSNNPSSYSFPGARSTVSTAPLATVPALALTPANEPMDILHSDQYVVGPYNESIGPLFSGNNTLEATLQEQQLESDGNGTEAIAIPGIAMYQPDNQNRYAEPAQTKTTARVFGPSRLVSLLPARKGGRKGALSKEELEKRRESRRAGVCIRCRQMKSKCQGGFPCTACIENSKATLWVRPCVKAHFLDIVESEPYFLEIASFKTDVLDRMSEEATLSQYAMIFLLGEPSQPPHLSLFAGGINGVAEFPCAIIWGAALLMLWESHESSFGFKDPMANIPKRIAGLRSSTSHIILGCRGEPETRDSWLFHRTLFCMSGSERWHPKDEDLPFYHAGFFDIYKQTRETLLWIGRRVEEIKLFRYFQDAANRLNSMSGEELLDFCTGTLHVLHYGMSEVYLKKLEMDRGEENNESQILAGTILDRKNRIRRALIIYLAIAVSKLPSGSKFWQEQQKPWLPASSDIFKRNLESLDAFDEEISNTAHKLENLFVKEFLFLDAIEKSKRGLPFLDLTEPGSDDQTLSRKAMQNVLKGPPGLRSELQRAVEKFEYLVKPILREIKDMGKSMDIQIIQRTLAEEDHRQDSAIGDLSEVIEAMEKHGQTVQQELREILEKKPRLEEIDSEFQSTGELLRRANTTFDDMLLVLERLSDEVSKALEIREIIETQRRADLPILNSADKEFSQRIFTDIREDFFSYLKVVRRISSFPEQDALTPEETILQQRLKKKLDSITLLVQKEKYKWLRLCLGHLIITDAIDQGIEYPNLHDFVNEFLDFFDVIDEAE